MKISIKKFLFEVAPLINFLQKGKSEEAEKIYQKLIGKYHLDDNSDDTCQNLLFMINAYLIDDSSTSFDEILNNYTELTRKYLDKKERLSIFN